MQPRAPLSSTAPIRRVLHEFRARLAITYGMFAVEMAASLLRPFFLGRAIDGLIAHSYRGLIELSASHLLYLLIGTIRHRYDTRTFTAVYTAFVGTLIAQARGAPSVSRLSAHASFARQVVDFLEFDFNYVVEAAYNIIGSLILLSVYNHTVVGICLGILAPVAIVGRLYGRRAARLNAEQHDELEQQVDVLAGGDVEVITAHFARLRTLQIHLSDQEAWNFGATELLVLLALVGSLLVYTGEGGAVLQVGGIVAMYNYVLRFATGLETIPYMAQRAGALVDILRRMKAP